MTGQYVLGSLASQAGQGAGLAVLMLTLVATVRTAEDAVLQGPRELLTTSLRLQVTVASEHLHSQEQVPPPVFISEKNLECFRLGKAVTFYTFGDSFKSPWKYF